MWNEPSRKRLDEIPKLYATESTPLEEKTIYLHFFVAGCDWYVAEFDGEDLFWGFAILNGDFLNSEWGYISYKELKKFRIAVFEVECEGRKWFPPKKASEVPKVARGNGWKGGF